MILIIKIKRHSTKKNVELNNNCILKYYFFTNFLQLLFFYLYIIWWMYFLFIIICSLKYGDVCNESQLINYFEQLIYRCVIEKTWWKGDVLIWKSGEPVYWTRFFMFFFLMWFEFNLVNRLLAFLFIRLIVKKFSNISNNKRKQKKKYFSNDSKIIF